MKLPRRDFLKASAATLAAPLAGLKSSLAAETSPPKPAKFFTVEKRFGRWWFITPDNAPMFSLGLNHIDPATLRYPENRHLWRDKYGNSMKRWLEEAVAPDLESWGFNSIGWSQEVISSGLTNHRNSRPFTFDEYQWLDMPYCHMLPFADFHQREAEVRHPDFFSTEFADWCDHVAREHCVPMSGDPKLMGYFYVDCPTWAHTRKENVWKGPLFDPEKLDTEAGRAELFKLATQFYRVTHDAIRRYDPHHLILGDRYEASALLPVEVVNAAKPYVDVLSFQNFGKIEKIEKDFDHWHKLTDMPVLLADGAGIQYLPDGIRRHDGPKHKKILEVLRTNPGCVGFHLCGAYMANRIRQRGLLDEAEVPDTEALDVITLANQETTDWVKSFQ